MDAKTEVANPATTKVFLMNSSLTTVVKNKLKQIKTRENTGGINMANEEEICASP